MTRPRAITLLLAVLALLAGPSALALAQGGAGDNQYQDPFANQPAKSPAVTKAPTRTRPPSSGSGTPTSGSSSAPTLSQAPPVPLPGNTSPPASPSPVPAPAAGPATSGVTGQLPRTGLDLNGIALLGVGLLVTGVGLRMRTADVRDY